MHLLASSIAVLALFGIAWIGVAKAGLYTLFGVALPYLAIAVFLIGVVWKVLSWARSPVPFQITTTCGQQKTLPWIQSAYFENPHTTTGVLGRMAMEVLFFRSLFRNTRMSVTEGRSVQGPSKWLWVGAIAFHYTFLAIFVRHLRFFTEPVPQPILWLQNLDGFMQVGVPVIYASTAIFLGAVAYLLVRRLFIPQVRFISLAADYFPLFLLIGIGCTGAWMRHLEKTDITAVKELGIGLLAFSPTASPDIHWLFYAHLTLVCVLLLYFPFSKLMHMGGVFLSPTRNMTGNTREIRHVNPWNYPVEVHSYAEYVEEFRDKMEAVDIPIDPIPAAPKE